MLLRDEGIANSQAFSNGDLTSFINRGMNERDLAARVLRVRISRVMVANQFAYTLSDIVSSGTVLTGPVAPNLIDPISVVINLTTGGTTTLGRRKPLGRVPYSSITPYLATNFASTPEWWASYGPGSSGSLFVAPPPAVAYPTEWDFFCYSPALVANGDLDPLPFPYTDCIPFYAAAFAKMQMQRFDEAGEFMKVAMERSKRFLVGGRPIAVRR